MNENYTFDNNAKDFRLYDESDNIVDKLAQIAYFIDTSLDLGYYRESSTTGLHLDEIEDLLVDLQDFLVVYEKVHDAKEAIEDYTDEEDIYGRGEMLYAIPKIAGIESMLEDIAEDLLFSVNRWFIHMCPPGTKYETRDGIKAFWTVYE